MNVKINVFLLTGFMVNNASPHKFNPESIATTIFLVVVLMSNQPRLDKTWEAISDPSVFIET